MTDVISPPPQIPIFSPVSDECKISDQYLIYYDDIHTDNPQ